MKVVIATYFKISQTLIRGSIILRRNDLLLSIYYILFIYVTLNTDKMCEDNVEYYFIVLLYTLMHQVLSSNHCRSLKKSYFFL